MPSAIAIVDAGPLIAAADAADPDHARCIAALEDPGLSLVMATLAVQEAAFIIGRRFGAEVESRFFASLAEHHLEAPIPADCRRIAELTHTYRDLPLGGADASVVTLAERLETPTVITLDRRRFSVVRPNHCEALELLPG